MKRSSLLLSSSMMALLSLAGCQGNQEGVITLFDETSKLVVQSFDEKGSVGLKTYHKSKTGVIP